MAYEPKKRVIDTSAVKLPSEIDELTEKLAENAHDQWASQRISQGWTYGKDRNDAEKRHPDLVPYDELSDQEKDYDRTTAMESLKAIIALGYRIVKAE